MCAQTADEVPSGAAADRPGQDTPWHVLTAQAVADALHVNPDTGLDPDEVERRLGEYGRNELPTEPSPSLWQVARGQLSNPMNIMLIIVGIASFAIGQIATGVVVIGLVTFNVVDGHEAGAEGARKRRGARRAPGAACPRPSGRPRRGGGVDRARARRRRPARGR